MGCGSNKDMGGGHSGDKDKEVRHVANKEEEEEEEEVGHRSAERREGEECSSGWSPDHEKKKDHATAAGEEE